MKLHVIKLCCYPRSASSPIDFDKLRFYIRKTLKYGTLVKMRHQKAYHITYHSFFASGFSVYVLVRDRTNQQIIKQQIIDAVIIQNDDRKEYSFSKQGGHQWR